MFVFRVSSAFVVLVLLSKSALFVADDSKFVEVESLGAIEKRVGKLIDEALRFREEENERREKGEDLAFAVAYVATRKAVRVCVGNACGWVRRAASGLATRVWATLHDTDPAGLTAPRDNLGKGSIQFNHLPARV
jgi:hypothetical protein